MEHLLLSIIVPVYNVEKYLAKCLRSLVSQQLERYEIIVINDGSTDNCQQIIEEYHKRYPSLIRPFRKENGGLSDARNFGLQYATGKYISFFDSDDYVDEDYFPQMVAMAETDQLDLVVANLEYVWEFAAREPMIKEGLNRRIRDTKKALFLSPLSVCNKLFRRDLFHSLQLQFYKGLWYEDIPVALLYCAKAKKVGHLKNSYYHYLQRHTSILGSGYSPKMYDIFTIFEKVIQEFKEKGIYQHYRHELEYLFIEHFLVYGAFRFLRTDHYQELMKKAFCFVKAEFPHYRKNPYISTFSWKNRLFLLSNNEFTMSFWHWYLCHGLPRNKPYDNLVLHSQTVARHTTQPREYERELSIIVPVYNVEKYLRKCLDSLVNQTMKDYEIIVVNDGSPDNCQQIIEEYHKRYPSLIRPFRKENGGLSDARNFGLRYARGKYICFLDSDDYVDNNYYKGMYDLAEKNSLDLVVSDLEYVWESEEKPSSVKEGYHNIGENVNFNLLLSPLFSWNKMYRHSLFEELNLQYPLHLWYEDIPVTLAYFANTHSLGYYHQAGIHYLQRHTSILGSGYSPKMYDIFTIFEKVIQEFKEKGIYQHYRHELEYLFIEHFLVYGAFRFLRTDHYQELMKKAFCFVKAEFPHYRKNPYISTFSWKNRLFLLSNNEFTMSFWHWYLCR